MSAMPFAQLKFINQLPLDPLAGVSSEAPVREKGVARLPRLELSGAKVRIPGSDALYVIDRHGYRRRIPFPLAFINLFKDSAFHSALISSSVAEIPEGPSLDDDSILLRGAASEHIYLLDGGRKRLIRGRAVMEKYGFNESSVVVIPQAVVDAVPAGDVWE